MPGGRTTLQRRLSIRADATVSPGEDGRFVLSEGHMRIPVGPLGPGLSLALTSLAQGQPTEVELVELVSRHENEITAVKLQMVLNRLRETGWLVTSLCDEQPGRAPRELAALAPIGHSPPARRTRPDLARPLVLSRFAHLRAEGGRAIVESPRVAGTLVIAEPGLGTLLALLSRPQTLPEIEPAMATIGCAPVDATALMRWLAEIEVVVNAGAEDDAELAPWSFSDLLFHARSRVGRNLGGYGGSYRWEGKLEPLPAIKPVVGEPVPLPAGESDGSPRRSMTLVDAVERRRSRRDHDPARPITVAELGELLHRVARARRVFHDGHEQLSSRPYPGGGALYELELYPLIDRCQGLYPGLYRYDPQGDQLESVCAPGPSTTLLLEYARHTAVIDSYPQVLLVIAARFGRAMWKYESMAYALVLKDVGVLYQTIMLTATAMGLAACPLGGGHADGFCDAAGVDYYAESSVGELILGRPVAEPTEQRP